MKAKYDKRSRGYKRKSKALKKVLKRGGPGLEGQVMKDMVLAELRRRKRKGVAHPDMASIKRKVKSDLMKEIRNHNLKLNKTKKKALKKAVTELKMIEYFPTKKKKKEKEKRD